jgi:acetyltransferase-like isoleucine patch superfamily enzyme
VLIGKNITLHRPGRVEVGNHTFIDDNVSLLVRGADGRIKLGEKVLIGKGCILQVRSGAIDISSYASISSYCRIGSTGTVSIGRYSLVSAFTYIGGANHSISRTDVPMMFQGVEAKGGVIIEDDVWIGSHCAILDGVRIGRGCVIGACSLVNTDIPEYSVAYGVPARIAGKRTADTSSDLKK